MVDIPQYFGAYVDGAFGYVASMGKSLHALERHAGDEGALNEFFRSAHMLKGASSTLGFVRIASLSHGLENVLDAIRSRQAVATPHAMGLLAQSVGALEEMVAALLEDGSERGDGHPGLAAALREACRGAGAGDGAGCEDGAGSAAAGSEDGAGSAAAGSALGGDVGDLRLGVPSAALAADAEPRLSECERDAVKMAVGDGWNAFLLRVALAKDCLMKSVRAFIAINAIERLAEIVSLAPCADDIEVGRFADGFCAVVLTHASQSALRGAVSSILDIERVDIELVDIERVAAGDGALGAPPAGDGAPGAPPAGDGAPGAPPTDAPPTGAADARHVPGAPPAGDSAPGAPPTGAPPAGDGAGARPEPGSAADVQYGTIAARRHAAAKDMVRVENAKLDGLVAVSSELAAVSDRLSALAPSGCGSIAAQAVAELADASARLRKSVSGLLMAPVGDIFSLYPRAVRDLSLKLGKDVELVTRGEDMEIGRSTLYRLNDPILLLIRNSIDHGIESADERRAAGKPQRGRVELAAYRDGDMDVVEVRDDGRGIDIGKLRRKAVETGVASAEEIAGASREEALMLVFVPAVSTKDIVSDISGRGVGMDAVKARVESLGGWVSIKTEDGRGVAVTIRIPTKHEAIATD